MCDVAVLHAVACPHPCLGYWDLTPHVPVAATKQTTDKYHTTDAMTHLPLWETKISQVTPSFVKTGQLVWAVLLTDRQNDKHDETGSFLNIPKHTLKQIQYNLGNPAAH
jgi:hypothetical protein